MQPNMPQNVPRPGGYGQPQYMNGQQQQQQQQPPRGYPGAPQPQQQQYNMQGQQSFPQRSHVQARPQICPRPPQFQQQQQPPQQQQQHMQQRPPMQQQQPQHMQPPRPSPQQQQQPPPMQMNQMMSNMSLGGSGPGAPPMQQQQQQRPPTQASQSPMMRPMSAQSNGVHPPQAPYGQNPPRPGPPQQQYQQQYQQPPQGGPMMGRGPPMAAPRPHQQQQQQQQSMPPPTQMAMPPRGAGPGQANPAGGGGGPPRRIDPAHMPRPSRNMERQDIYTRQCLGQGKKLIPRCTDDFRAVDDGNANPKYMRMTMQQFPATGSLLNMSQIPLACAIQPFARLQDGEEEPMFVDLGPNGPTRCKRCRCYVNCFCPFDHSAGWWQCNLCKQQNALPPQYQGNYNSMYGSSQQPELAKGSVDFIVQGDYVSRPLQEPILLFAVDVSTAARQTGTCGAVLRSIQKIISDHVSGAARIMGNERARVGILTYAQGVHFYDMYTPSGSGHKVLIVSDAEEGFCPLPPSRLVVNVDQHGAELEALLDSLVEEYGDPIPPVPGQQPGQGPPNASVAGTAFQAAVHGLELCGGKLAFFLTQPPTFGVGTTTTRKEDPQGYASARESGMYTLDVNREETVFTKTATRCCEMQISVDLYAFGDDHKDLASWGVASNLTGGEVRRFPLLAVDDAISQAAFRQALEHNVRRNAALEAVLKVRASSGMRVVEYFGNGLKRTRGGELDMAFINEDNTSLVVLDHDGTNVEAESEVYLQCAVLYTSVQGQRRVRVHNLAVTVTNTIADVFRNADVDTIANLLARKAVDQMQRNTPVAKVHADMEQQIVKMLCSYRKNCAKNPTGQQLILPEALKLLPLYAVSAEKLPALRRNLESLKSHRSNAQSALVRADARYEDFNLLQRQPLSFFLDYIYPAVYSLQKTDTAAVLPQKRNLAPSLASFRDDDQGVIVLCNGIDVLLFILPSTDPALVQLATGHPSYNAALEATKQSPYPERGMRFVAQPGSHHFVEALEAFIRREIACPRASADSLLGAVSVFVRGSQHERDTLRYMVEDSLFQLKSMPAYDDFLCTIHQSIQTQMRG